VARCLAQKGPFSAIICSFLQWAASIRFVCQQMAAFFVSDAINPEIANFLKKND
jgi:hypothetical protein